MKRKISVLLTASFIIGCSDVGAQDASLTYDLGSGPRKLQAYPIEQSDWMPKPAKLANGAETLPPMRWPKLAYFCVWRDISQEAMFTRATSKGSPSQIFFVCIFGTSRWTPPPPDRLLELASERATREESVIRMVWERRGAEYVATRFEVTIRNPGQFEFSSQNFDAKQMANVRIKVHAMAIPNSPDAPFSFDLEVSAPGTGSFLTNSPPGRRSALRAVSLSLKGTATAHPRWLVY